MSAVERTARVVPMSTRTKHVPRSGGMGMDILDQGDSYTEDSTTDDEIQLTARKYGRAISLDEDELADTANLVNVLETKRVDWATAYAKALDNATLAVTAAESVANDVPHTSVYRSVRTTDSDISYTADTNHTETGTGGVTYSNLSTAVGLYEQGDYYDPAQTRVWASPIFRQRLRDIKDDQSRPIFVEGTGGTPDTLFSIPIEWTQGARTSASATPAPSGNPLLIVGNREFLVLGRRSGPESYVADASMGPGFSTDETKLKVRARRGFAVGHPTAFSVLEDNGTY